MNSRIPYPTFQDKALKWHKRLKDRCARGIVTNFDTNNVSQILNMSLTPKNIYRKLRHFIGEMKGEEKSDCRFLLNDVVFDFGDSYEYLLWSI